MDPIWTGKRCRTQSFWIFPQTITDTKCLHLSLHSSFHCFQSSSTLCFLPVYCCLCLAPWRASQSISARNLLLPYFHFAIFHFFHFSSCFNIFQLFFTHFCYVSFISAFFHFSGSFMFSFLLRLFSFFLSFWHLSGRRHPLQAHQIDVPEKKVQTSVGPLCFPFSLSRSLVFILLLFCFQVINISFLGIMCFSFLFMFFHVFHLKLPSCLAHCLYLPQFSSHVCCSFHFPFFHVCLFFIFFMFSHFPTLFTFLLCFLILRSSNFRVLSFFMSSTLCLLLFSFVASAPVWETPPLRAPKNELPQKSKIKQEVVLFLAPFSLSRVPI